MSAYTFRLVILAGRFAENIILPACSPLKPQDFLDITVVSGVTPVMAVQDLLRRYRVNLPENAIRVLDTAPEQGVVLLAALTADDVAGIPMLHDFEVQRTDGALVRAWTTGRVVNDFFAVMGMARAAYDSLMQARQKATRRPAALPA